MIFHKFYDGGIFCFRHKVIGIHNISHNIWSGQPESNRTSLAWKAKARPLYHARENEFGCVAPDLNRVIGLMRPKGYLPPARNIIIYNTNYMIYQLFPEYYVSSYQFLR